MAASRRAQAGVKKPTKSPIGNYDGGGFQNLAFSLSVQVRAVLFLFLPLRGVCVCGPPVPKGFCGRAFLSLLESNATLLDVST